MNKSKTLIAAGLFLLLTTVTSAKTLTTYNQISKTLEGGGSVFLSIKPEKCKVETSDGSKSVITKVGVKFNDLIEWVNHGNGGREMKALGNQETGLFGSTKFDWFRNLTAIYEDGTVLVVSDHVDPTTFNLTVREKITCKLTSDNSGGVTVTELRS